MNATIQALAEYRSKFGNKRYRVEIVDSTSPTENIRSYDITPSGAVISYESSDNDVYQPIISSTCRFTFICETIAQIDFLEGVAKSTEGKYGVRILVNDDNLGPSVACWVGVIISDQITLADDFPQAVNIVATDDLGYLKDEPYLQSDGTRFTGTATVLEHVVNCLSKLRTDWHYNYFLTILGTNFYSILVSMGKDILPEDYVSAGVLVDFYEESKIQHNAFYADGAIDTSISCYEVLEQICKFFNCQIYQTHNRKPTYFNFQPVGAVQKYSDDGTNLTGFTYRYDKAYYTTTPTQFTTLACSNDASTKVRLAGGAYSFLQPYKQVTRSVDRVQLEDSIFRALQETAPDTDAWGVPTSVFGFMSQQLGVDYTFNDKSYSEGEELRLQMALSFNWNGSNSVAQTIYTNSGGTGTMPENYNIGRIRVRISLEMMYDADEASPDGDGTGNNRWLKRGLTSGEQVPVYQDYNGFTSTPQYYTDSYIGTGPTWGTSTSDAYVVISQPFDVSVDQNIMVNIDEVLPPIEAVGSYTPIAVQVGVYPQFLAPDNTELVNTSSSNGIIFEHSIIEGFYSLSRFNGFGVQNAFTVIATNDNETRKTLDTGSMILSDWFLSLGAITYRQSGGAYNIEESGYTSLMQTSPSQYPAATLATREIGNFYARYRKIYNGVFIKQQLELSTIFTIQEEQASGGTETTKYKILKMSYNTGLEETEIAGVQVARDAVFTVAVTGKGGKDSVDDPVLPNGNPNDTGLVNGLITNTQAKVAPAITVTSAAAVRDRTSQTGQQIAAIDANGVIQEIADGSSGHILSTNGSGVYSFGAQSFMYMLASHSFMGSLGREDYYYYGSNFYGFSSFTLNSSASGISTIQDDYAHNGIVVPYAFTRLIFKSTIRNDSNANDIDVTILKGARPNGSSSAITLTSLGTGSANNDAGVDLHYNCDIDITGLSITAGELIFVVFKRADGGSVTTTINVSYSLLAIT